MAGRVVAATLGVQEEAILVTQGNLANTYQELGRLEEALSIRQEAYAGYKKVLGKENRETLREANNYASLLKRLKHFEEAKSLLRKTTRVAPRSLGEDHDTTLKSRWIYARVLCEDPAATLDDLREAVTTLEEVEPIARRVLGGAHPTALSIEATLRIVRGMLAVARDALGHSGG